MEMTTHALGWFELSVSDFDRAKRFYSAIFDYDMPEMMMGPARMGFLPHDQGQGVGGAIIACEGRVPSREGTLVYLAGGADLSVVLDRVAGAGGTVLEPKTPITPEYGFFAFFHDSEGNKVGLHSMG